MDWLAEHSVMALRDSVVVKWLLFWQTCYAMLFSLRHRETFLVVLFRIFGDGPLSSILPVSLALVFRKVLLSLHKEKRRGGPMHLIYVSLRAFGQLWTVLEVLHFAHYLFLRRRLSRRRHLQPRTRQAKGRRLELLKKNLRLLEHAAVQHKEVEPGTEANNHSLNSPRSGIHLNSPLSRAGRRLNIGSVDDLTQAIGANAAATQARAATILRIASSGRIGSVVNPQSGTFDRFRANISKVKSFGQFPLGRRMQRECSAEALLREWSSEKMQPEDEEARMLALRRADISGWFYGVPVEEIYRDNCADWIAEYFFYGATPEEVSAAPHEKEELDEMVTLVAAWIGNPQIKPGRNPSVSCMRVSRDPIPSMHRPRLVYFVTSSVLPKVVEVRCQMLGFQKFMSGQMEYWHCPRRTGKATSLKEPIVFCHGLGSGVLPYIDLVNDLMTLGCEMFLLDMPHISLRPKTDIPSSRETVAQVVDMLQAWGHSSAHFVGHSFGAIVVSWLLKRSHCVASAALLDPACFLLVKHHLLSNVLYQPQKNFIMVLLSYFVFQELYIAHTLCRNFFWDQNNLLPDEINRPTLVMLSGNDDIVPAHSVRSMLEAERRRRFSVRTNDKLARDGTHKVHQNLGLGADLMERGKVSSSVELSPLQPGRELDLQVANTSLDIMWVPEAGHCSCWAVPKVRKQVVERIQCLLKEAEGLIASPRG